MISIFALYKYASRGHSPHPTIAPLRAAQPAGPCVGLDPPTPSMLAAALAQEQKQMLGERLIPLIQTLHSKLAGKMKGMLLGTGDSQLLCVL